MASETAKRRVLIVDNRPVVRAGLHRWLSETSDLSIVAEASNATEAIAAAVQVQPNVLLAALNLPDRSGVDVCREVMRRSPRTAVLLLGKNAKDSTLAEAWEAGALGVLPERVERSDILEAIRAANRGHLVFTANEMARIRAWRAWAVG